MITQALNTEATHPVESTKTAERLSIKQSFMQQSTRFGESISTISTAFKELFKREDGDIGLTEEQKSRVTLFIAFGEFAATLPMRWAYVLNKLRERAIAEQKPITNVEDIGRKVGLTYDENEKVWRYSHVISK